MFTIVVSDISRYEKYDNVSRYQFVYRIPLKKSSVALSIKWESEDRKRKILKAKELTKFESNSGTKFLNSSRS